MLCIYSYLRPKYIISNCEIFCLLDWYNLLNLCNKHPLSQNFKVLSLLCLLKRVYFQPSLTNFSSPAWYCLCGSYFSMTFFQASDSFGSNWTLLKNFLRFSLSFWEQDLQAVFNTSGSNPEKQISPLLQNYKFNS